MDTDMTVLTAQIVTAHVANNAVPEAELPELIRRVYSALTGLNNPVAEPTLEPKVPIKRSVTEDKVFCFECGKGFAMLRRHLSTDHGMTPEEYRTRWKLPREYPLVAPNYTKVRSNLAKKAGLGRKRRHALVE